MQRGSMTAAVRQVESEYRATDDGPGPWCQVGVFPNDGTAHDKGLAYRRAVSSRGYLRRTFPEIQFDVDFHRGADHHRIMARHVGPQAAPDIEPPSVLEVEADYKRGWR